MSLEHARIPINMRLLCYRRNVQNVTFLIVTSIIIVAVLYMFYYSIQRQSVDKTSYSRTTPPIPPIPSLKINPEYFINDFLIQPSTTLCAKSPSIHIVMIIFSHVGNYHERLSHRHMLTSEILASLNMTRIFIVGGIPEMESRITQPELVDESNIYGDILQGNFTENYKNLTHKHLMGLHWASTYCKQIKFIIKSNDNADFSMKPLVDLIHNLWQKNQADQKIFIMGFIRDIPPKYRISLADWYAVREHSKHPKHLPPYLPGWLYFTTPRVGALITREAMNHPYFWKDDIFVTGVIAAELHIRLLQIPTHMYVTLDFKDF